jgi:hypothetical protein
MSQIEYEKQYFARQESAYYFRLDSTASCNRCKKIPDSDFIKSSFRNEMIELTTWSEFLNEIVSIKFDGSGILIIN